MIITSASTTTKPTATLSFKTLAAKRFAPTRSGTIGRSIENFLAPFSDNAHAVPEATRNWTVMYDWLDEICDNVVLAHPLKVKAIAEAKIKTDKIDATILSHLLRADLVPTAHAPSHQARELRLALRERMFYVRLRTMVKNRTFDRYPEQTAQLKRCTDLFGGDRAQAADRA
jgi:transposase